jgi:hypothetical protein
MAVEERGPQRRQKVIEGTEGCSEDRGLLRKQSTIERKEGHRQDRGRRGV